MAEGKSSWQQWAEFIREYMPKPLPKPYKAVVFAVKGQHAHVILIHPTTKQEYHFYAELMYHKEAYDALPKP